MRTDLTIESVVMATQTQAAFDPVPRGQVIPPNQVMGLQIAPPAAIGTIAERDFRQNGWDLQGIFNH